MTDRSFRDGLLIAASILDDVCHIRPTEKMRALCAAATMDAFVMSNPDRADLEILDAAEAIRRIATGRPLDLNDAGRHRAGHLASRIRLLADDAGHREIA